MLNEVEYFSSYVELHKDDCSLFFVVSQEALFGSIGAARMYGNSVISTIEYTDTNTNTFEEAVNILKKIISLFPLSTESTESRKKCYIFTRCPSVISDDSYNCFYVSEGCIVLFAYLR